MAIKHNFSELFDGSNLFDGLFILMNKGEHIFYYGVLFLVFVVFAIVFIRKTEDTGKAMLMSLFVTFLFGLLIFYYGLVIGQIFIPELVMYTMVVILLMGTAMLHYRRQTE